MQSLILTGDFNIKSDLPPNLKYLRFGYENKTEFNHCKMPESLTHLVLGSKYNEKLNPGFLPQNLEVIFFGKYYNEIINEKSIPISVEMLCVHVKILASERINSLKFSEFYIYCDDLEEDPDYDEYTEHQWMEEHYSKREYYDPYYEIPDISAINTELFTVMGIIKITIKELDIAVDAYHIVPNNLICNIKSANKT